uniref:Large ribosomal subunit protein uL23c n=1 Tax=Udotea sp. TZ0819 TaxID=2364085 RepID=A0A386B238_9CHLO|nr:ribosomal protein L23 [Udotea sp. TZ0819]
MNINKFNEVQWNKNIFNFLKRPIITDKTTKLVEQKQYVFDVNLQLTKKQIKKIFEEYYESPVKSIKTFRKNQKNKKSPNKRVILRFLKEISI